jgi:predicted nucleotide-binding protein
MPYPRSTLGGHALNGIHTMAKNIQKPPRNKVSQSEFPNNSLESAIRVARGLWDQFAGKSAAPHNLAMAIDLSPTSSGWRYLCGSAIAYGLTDGGYNANLISLTDLGRRVVAPTLENDDRQALKEALVKPRIANEFFQRYDKAKFPRDEIAQNVLVELGLPKDRAQQALDILKTNGKFVGAIIETKTGPFVALEGSRPAVHSPSHEDQEIATQSIQEDVSNEPFRAPQTSVPQSQNPKHLFIAHGKNRKPLDDLKKVLDQFKIRYKVAVDEPHGGRPISAKVAQLMKDCSAGIFIFTKDQQFFSAEQQEIWRPSENVVYELGAASILWDKKIIIMKEDGVQFPSDFSDLGYIPFSDHGVQGQALDILKELVGLGLVTVQAG